MGLLLFWSGSDSQSRACVDIQTKCGRSVLCSPMILCCYLKTQCSSCPIARDGGQAELRPSWVWVSLLPQSVWSHAPAGRCPSPLVSLRQSSPLQPPHSGWCLAIVAVKANRNHGITVTQQKANCCHCLRNHGSDLVFSLNHHPNLPLPWEKVLLMGLRNGEREKKK